MLTSSTETNTKMGRRCNECSNINLSSSQSPFPRPMAHRAAPISVSIALGHASANAVKATVGGGGRAGPLVAPRV